MHPVATSVWRRPQRAEGYTAATLNPPQSLTRLRRKHLQRHLMTELSPPRARVALLVDGENLSAIRSKDILDLAHVRGDVLIRRVYGKLTDLQTKGWSNAAGFRLIPATNAKNSADLLLSVDAMELALDGRADCIVIAASDNDYSHVAIKLRERGFSVHGLIDAIARCDDLRSCYATVQDLPMAPEKAATAPPQSSPTATPTHALKDAPAQLNQFPKLVAALIKSNPDSTGCPIAELNVPMHKQHHVLISKTPFKTWRNFLAAHPDKFVIDAKGPDARVRVKA